MPKTLSPQSLIAAVHLMLSGRTYYPHDFLASAEAGQTKTLLTPREREVLQGLTEGRSNKEIAREFDIQEVTVKLHVKTLSRKLGARNRTHAAMIARDQGLI